MHAPRNLYRVRLPAQTCGTFTVYQNAPRMGSLRGLSALAGVRLVSFRVRETVGNSWLESTANEEDQQRFMLIWETQVSSTYGSCPSRIRWPRVCPVSANDRRGCEARWTLD